MIEARDFAALREVFHEWPPADVAEVILDLPEDEQVIIFRVLPHDLAADVFEYLDLDAQQTLLRAMAHEQVVAILNEMAPDDRTALLEEVPSAAARQLDLPRRRGHSDAAGKVVERAVFAGRGAGPPVQGRVSHLRSQGPAEGNKLREHRHSQPQAAHLQAGVRVHV